MNKTLLVIVDMQNDFCGVTPNLKDTGFEPALLVPNALKDCERVAQFIRQNAHSIDAVETFFDTHHTFDINHLDFWMFGNGQPLEGIVNISKEDIESGLIVPRLNFKKEMLAYLNDLEREYGIGEIYAYPVHCRIGSIGHNLNSYIADALVFWEKLRLTNIIAVFKGQYPLTEHYSGLKARYSYHNISSSLLRTESITRYESYDRVVFVGEASSHCVKDHVNDAMKAMPEGFDYSRFHVLVDCMSPIPGFEAATQQFFEDIRTMGVQVYESANFGN